MIVRFDSMKNLLLLLVIASLLTSCKEEAERPATEYIIYQIGYMRAQGTVTVTDLDVGKIAVEVQLVPFQDGSYPTHLHFGSINLVGELAYRLNDLDGKTGKSRTVLDNVELSDGTLLTYDLLMEMDGSIKVHMAQPELKDAVVAFGNIGKNDNYLSSGISICTGH